jgi:hypothetical protein
MDGPAKKLWSQIYEPSQNEYEKLLSRWDDEMIRDNER